MYACLNLESQKQGQKRKQVKYLAPDYSTQKSKFSLNLKPEVIGEISVCFIAAQGYYPDYNLIGVTHISPTSTKVPVLFVNNLVGVCRVDYQHDLQTDKNKRSDDYQYIKSIDKVKYFPNQTYIFPSHSAIYEDLLFSKAVYGAQTTNYRSQQFIDERIKLFEKNQHIGKDCLIPTTLLQEKFMNPFLNPEKFHKLLGVQAKQKEKCFGLLRKMRNQWKVSK